MPLLVFVSLLQNRLAEGGTLLPQESGKSYAEQHVDSSTGFHF
jgi:hypothetical protein